MPARPISVIAEDLLADPIVQKYGHIRAQVERGYAAYETFRQYQPVIRQDLSIVQPPRDEPSPFESYKELLAATMAAAFGVTAEIAVETILRILGDPIDVRKMEAAFEAVHPLMLSTWREQDQDRAEQIIRQAYQEGAGVVGNPNMLEDLPRYDQYAANQASNTAFCSNNFWQFGLVPAISAAFEKTVTDNTEGEVDDNIRKWAELIGPIVLREIPFWPLVSSGVASRAYHWALTKAGTIGGFRGYTVRANGDEATSEICQIMHGREYWLADAERTYDQVVNAQDEQARDIQVYVTPEQARSFQRQTGRGSEGLAPPFHFSCRTTIRLLPY